MKNAKRTTKAATRTAAKPAKKAERKSQKYYFETGFHLRRAEKEALRAKGLQVYDRRDNGKETTIEPSVGVDFMGTLITNFKIPFKKKGPEAYTIYNGDAYLRDVKANRVYRVNEIPVRKKAKRK